MHLNLLFSLIFVLTATSNNVLARFVAEPAPATYLHDVVGRQATSTTTPDSPESAISQDPWQCVTENITQYFVDVPTPTGNVRDAINSFGGDVSKPCLSTATGLDIFSCTVPDPKSWCAFTTAVPTNVLSSYSTYLFAVTSFWKARSEKVSVLSTSCPVAWGKPEPGQREWLKIAIAHAECYIQAHPVTRSPTSTSSSSLSHPASSSPSSNAATSTTTTARGLNLCGQSLEGYVLMSTGLAALVNVAL